MRGNTSRKSRKSKLKPTQGLLRWSETSKRHQQSTHTGSGMEKHRKRQLKVQTFPMNSTRSRSSPTAMEELRTCEQDNSQGNEWQPAGTDDPRRKAPRERGLGSADLIALSFPEEQVDSRSTDGRQPRRATGGLSSSTGRGGSCERCAHASLPCRGRHGSTCQPGVQNTVLAIQDDQLKPKPFRLKAMAIRPWT